MENEVLSIKYEVETSEKSNSSVFARSEATKSRSDGFATISQSREEFEIASPDKSGIAMTSKMNFSDVSSTKYNVLRITYGCPRFVDKAFERNRPAL